MIFIFLPLIVLFLHFLLMGGMRIDYVNGQDVGTTSGTKEVAGTFTIASDTQTDHIRIIGILLRVIAGGTKTAAEANLGHFIVNSKALGWVNKHISLGQADGGNPATNIGALTVFAKFEPIMQSGNFVGSTIEVDFSAENPEPTQDFDIDAFLVYDNGDAPQEIIDKWVNYGVYGILPPADLGDVANDDEIGDLTTEVMDDSISLQNAEEIYGVETSACPDALLTDGESFVPYIELVGAGLPQPSYIPVPAYGIELGTAVGRGIVTRDYNVPYWNKLGNANPTLTPTVHLVEVTTGANAVHINVRARSKNYKGSSVY